MFSHKEEVGDSQSTILLTRVSPVAWQHINIQGRYEFRKQPEHININDIIQQLLQVEMV